MRIAVIGSGISGLSAAWLAAKAGHEVTLYEQNARAGGHARTITVQTPEGAVDVDTGFIVFNDRNYPNLMAFFKELGVAYQPSNMSFAARFASGFEYSSKSPRGIFPTFATLCDARRWRMLIDFFKFGKAAKAFLKAPDDSTLGDFIGKSKLSDTFVNCFLLPMGAAIWSCPLTTIRLYPAASFLGFFANHGLLDMFGQPQWFTVTGGSKRYVDAVLKSLGDMGAQIRFSQRGLRVAREEGGRVCISNTEGQSRFDHVIIAAHADEALAMIEAPSRQEREVLSSFHFQQNTAYLHSDTALMPSNTACWASWVYVEGSSHDAPTSLTITYWMNLLQNLPRETPLLVTLNPSKPPAEHLTYDTAHFAHPIFDERAIEAQGKIDDINNANHLSFVGAWQRNGFHEDGIWSSVRAAAGLGISPPWGQY